MIVVRIELWPMGDSRYLEPITQLTISNVGPTTDGRHSYSVVGGTRVIELSHRRDAGVLALVGEALTALRSSAGDPSRLGEATP